MDIERILEEIEKERRKILLWRLVEEGLFSGEFMIEHAASLQLRDMASIFDERFSGVIIGALNSKNEYVVSKALSVLPLLEASKPDFVKHTYETILKELPFETIANMPFVELRAFLALYPSKSAEIVSRRIEGVINYPNMMHDILLLTPIIAGDFPDQAIDIVKKGVNHESGSVRTEARKAIASLARTMQTRKTELYRLVIESPYKDSGRMLDLHIERKFERESMVAHRPTISAEETDTACEPVSIDHLVNMHYDAPRFVSEVKAAIDRDARGVEQDLRTALEQIARNHPRSFVLIHEQGLCGKDYRVAAAIAGCVGALLPVDPAQAVKLYESGIHDSRHLVKHSTIQNMRELGEIMPEKAIELCIKAIHSECCEQYTSILTPSFDLLASLSINRTLELHRELQQSDDNHCRNNSTNHTIRSILKTLSEPIQHPWEGRELDFIRAYLKSRYVRTEDDPRQDDDIINEIKDMLNSPGNDYDKMIKAIKDGSMKDLDELIECCEASVPGCFALRKIGAGTYKRAYLCEIDELPGIRYTLLVTDVKRLSAKAKHYLEKLGRTALENCRGEAHKLAKLNFLLDKNLPRIVSLPTYDEKKGAYYWIEEYVDKKLSDVIMDKPIPVSTAMQLMFQVVSGLRSAIRLNYIHGDINLENLGISNGVVKILDWGLCSTIPPDTSEFEGRDFLGYRLTRAPEIYEGNTPTEKSDIWSIGIMVYRMLIGEYPFKWSFDGSKDAWKKLSMDQKQQYEDEIHEQVRAYCRNPGFLQSVLDEHIGGQVPSIITKCLAPDPAKRPTIEQLRISLESFQ